MKTEQEQIEEIMETLLAHQPFIDVTYEKIYDIAIALAKEGYGNISEYKAEIERLKAENKSQERENGFLKYCQCLTHGVDGSNHIKQAQIDVLNNVKDVLTNQKHECLERNNLTGYSAICECEKYVDELIKEVENE